MRTPSALPVFFLATSIAGGALLSAAGTAATGQTPHPSRKPAEVAVTPVVGPSWLTQLKITDGSSSLGRGAGRYGPPVPAPRPAVGATSFVPGQAIVLTGADLYRLNCQACHRAEGTGSPPEIKSLLYLVQGSSFELVRRQLHEEGKAVNPAAIRTQVAQARTALNRRIREGGQRMPPLAHLGEADVAVLYAYLTELAQTPDPERQSRETVSWARLGEHVVKGTCHICHDAVGPRPTRDAMLRGVIPPLSILLADNPQVAFVAKARSGAPLLSGRTPFHFRGRMPVFYYLRDEELAAAYDYLIAYPPRAE